MAPNQKSNGCNHYSVKTNELNIDSPFSILKISYITISIAKVSNIPQERGLCYAADQNTPDKTITYKRTAT